jgi:hypothetical protein
VNDTDFNLGNHVGTWIVSAQEAVRDVSRERIGRYALNFRIVMKEWADLPFELAFGRFDYSRAVD